MSQELFSEGEGAGMSTLSLTEIAEWRRAAEIITPAPADPGTPVKRTWSAKEGEIKEEGMETDPSPHKMKSSQGGGKGTSTMKFV
jgi:hypothetical protein